jgi:mRNA interferase RelE/StbE
LTSYRLVFRKKARKDWDKLGDTLRQQFRKKLNERLIHPRVPKDALRRFPNCYKIKLQKSGYRLAYRVDDDRVIVIVLAVGQREGDAVYEELAARFPEEK